MFYLPPNAEHLEMTDDGLAIYGERMMFFTNTSVSHTLFVQIGDDWYSICGFTVRKIASQDKSRMTPATNLIFRKHYEKLIDAARIIA